MKEYEIDDYQEKAESLKRKECPPPPHIIGERDLVR